MHIMSSSKARKPTKLRRTQSQTPLDHVQMTVAKYRKRAGEHADDVAKADNQVSAAEPKYVVHDDKQHFKLSPKAEEALKEKPIFFNPKMTPGQRFRAVMTDEVLNKMAWQSCTH